MKTEARKKALKLTDELCLLMNKWPDTIKFKEIKPIFEEWQVAMKAWKLENEYNCYL